MRVIGDLSRLNAIRYPHKAALTMRGAVLSYAELQRRSNQLAHALLAAGIAPGERIGLLAHNRLDYAVIDAPSTNTSRTARGSVRGIVTIVSLYQMSNNCGK